MRNNWSRRRALFGVSRGFARFQTTVLARNQKLGLVCALLEMGNWQLAKQLLDRFPEFYAVNAS